MNDENLKPCAYKLSREEAKRGGIASGEARRRRRALRDDLCALLDTKVKNGDGDEKTTQEIVVLKLVNKAIKGDLRAVEIIGKLLGEFTDKHEITGADGRDLFSRLSDEELERKIQELKERMG